MGIKCCNSRTTDLQNKDLPKEIRYQILNYNPCYAIDLLLQNYKILELPLKERILKPAVLSVYPKLYVLCGIFKGKLSNELHIAMLNNKMEVTVIKEGAPLTVARSSICFLASERGETLFAIGGEEEEECPSLLCDRYYVEENKWSWLPSTVKPEHYGLAIGRSLFAFSQICHGVTYEHLDLDAEPQEWNTIKILFFSDLKLDKYGLAIRGENVLIFGGINLRDGKNVSNSFLLKLSTGEVRISRALKLSEPSQFYPSSIRYHSNHFAISENLKLHKLDMLVDSWTNTQLNFIEQSNNQKRF